MPTNHARRFCLHEVNLFDGGPPEWIQLIPAGLQIKALDGRVFNNPRPEQVIKAFEKDPRDVPIDWEHATEIKAPEGDEAPAAGWIKALEVRSGGIWARVEWTPRGDQMLRNKEYRYISPAFWTDKKNNVLEIISAGLTNRPALDLPQLASEKPSGPDARNMEIDNMDPKLLALLGLDANASAEAVATAVSQLKVDAEKFRLANEKLEAELASAKKDLEGAKVELATARSAEPPLDKFVPRADHDLVVARAETAEAKLKEQGDAAHEEKIEAVIKQALDEGKITPATKDYYVAQCRKEGGLELFADFVKAAPVVANKSKLDNTPVPKPGEGVSDVELEIARNCNVSKENYEKFRHVNEG